MSLNVNFPGHQRTGSEELALRRNTGCDRLSKRVTAEAFTCTATIHQRLHPLTPGGLFTGARIIQVRWQRRAPLQCMIFNPTEGFIFLLKHQNPSARTVNRLTREDVLRSALAEHPEGTRTHAKFAQ